MSPPAAVACRITSEWAASFRGGCHRGLSPAIERERTSAALLVGAPVPSENWRSLPPPPSPPTVFANRNARPSSDWTQRFSSKMDRSEPVQRRRLIMKKLFHFDAPREKYRCDAAILGCFDNRFE